MEVNHVFGKQKFKGHWFADKMIESMKNGTIFCLNHLCSKDVKKKRGVIETTIIFYPFDGEGKIEAQCVGGFFTDVDLPFHGKTKGLVNPVKSPALKKYLYKYKLRSLPLWMRTGVSCCELSKNMKLPGNNQELRA